MKKPDSILIVRLSAIGDVVHALPVLDTIRQQLPEAKIGWVVEELAAPLLQNHPQLDKLYVIPKKRWRKNKRIAWSEGRAFFREIRAEKWDAALDLQGLSKSALAGLFSGAKKRVGFAGVNAREISGFVNNVRIRPHGEDKHVVAQNLRLIEGIGLQVPHTPPRGIIGIGDDEKDAMRSRLREVGWNNERFFALNPGAGWETKRWPPRFYGELGRLIHERTGWQPMVFWGPGEESQRDEIAAILKQIPALVAPKTSVRELAVLISLCDLFVGGDTGASHMCGPLDVPVLSVWGASDPLRNAPWTSAERGMHAQASLECVPCWKTKCPLAAPLTLTCLTELTPERVMERAEPWLASLE